MAQIEQFKIIGSNGVVHWLKEVLYILYGINGPYHWYRLFLSKDYKSGSGLLSGHYHCICNCLDLIFPQKQWRILPTLAEIFQIFIFHRSLFSGNLQIIFPYALIMAGVGLIESLLTLSMVDEITNTKGNTNRESVAQGVANITNGFFGGMGGCAMVAQNSGES
jgi:SulP family sulfate permease